MKHFRKYFLFTISTLILFWSLSTSANQLLSESELINAAQSGNPQKQEDLAHWYYTKKQYKQAVYWYKKVAAVGGISARATLGLCYAAGNGLQQDTKKALKILLPLAKAGSVNAQYNLGTIYFNGIGVRKNYDKAKYWIEKAAKQNFPAALFGLGQIYYYGNGIRKNPKKGFSLISRSAHLGYGLAQYKLGGFYGSGNKDIPISQNVILAYEWETLSRLNGHPEDKEYTKLWQELSDKIPYCIAAGQLGVGIMYRNGLAGLPRDEHKAYEWYRNALSTDPHAAEVKFNLAKLYMKGAGVKQDLTTAFQLTQEAALKPLGPAQQQLAYLYLAGMGVQKNVVMGYAWLLLAQYNYENPSKEYANKFHYQCPGGLQTDALQNATQVKRALEKLDGELTNTQKAQAKARYQQLKQAQTKCLAGDMRI